MFTALTNGVLTASAFIAIVLVSSADIAVSPPSYPSQAGSPVLCGRASSDGGIRSTEFSALPIAQRDDLVFESHMLANACTTQVSDPFEDQINAIRAVCDDWDGDGAPAPTPSALERISSVGADLITSGLMGAELLPDADGGAGFWIDSIVPFSDTGKHRSAWVVCRNDGQNFVVMHHNVPTRDIEFQRFEPSERESIARMMVAIKRFLAV